MIFGLGATDSDREQALTICARTAARSMTHGDGLPLLRTLTLVVVRGRVLQSGWFDLRLGLFALQPCDLVAQLLNPFLLMVADLQQTQHQGRDLIGGQLGKLRDSWEAV